MVLSPNDEEVADSSKKHTQFKSRVHKPYPVSDQNGLKKIKHTLWRGTYRYSLYKGLPPERKTRLAALYASETNQVTLVIEISDFVSVNHLRKFSNKHCLRLHPVYISGSEILTTFSFLDFSKSS